ncbi:phragmoplastin interacting protein 1 [Mercurialis annua]|uniref:phragmoplastin interacting protein 1 n=1 Tax=Mercurialis annua TaxID=3986 RepID=UPI0021605C1E|nr:phragmoplastin interacting protein 1 [Mercurialis annua]
MVLSNKKLKQKLRVAKVQSLLTTDCNSKQLPTQNGTSRLQELLEASKQRSKTAKKEKRREKIQPLQGLVDTQLENNGENKLVEEKNEKGLVGEGNDGENNEENIKKKKKKRKRDDGESKENGGVENGDNGAVKETKKATKKKNKKKKRKSKKAKNVEVKEVGGEAKDAVEVTNVISESHINEESATKVYVGGIPYYSTEDDIRSFFESCGTITEIDCMTFPDSGKFRGIAIIGFKTEAAAGRALALDGSDMGGFFLKIQPYKMTRMPQAKKVSDFAPTIVEGYNRIYVGNLSWDITEKDLRDFFSDCKISSVRWGTDKETGEFRGYGHVDFSDNISLLMALKLDQLIVCGRAIKISCAVPLKKGEAHSTPAPKATAHSTPAPIATAQSTPAPIATFNEADDGGLSAVSGKMRRRTCYECNQKGHVSTACPNKLATAPTSAGEAASRDIGADNDGLIIRSSSAATGYEAYNNASASITAPKYTDNEADNNGVTVSSGKMRRRTCYECNQKGHVSTACPNKLATAVTTMGQAADNNASIAASRETSNAANNDGLIIRSSSSATGYEADYNASASIAAPKDTDNEADNNGVTVSSGKIRRRTCYECNQRGHISTACPNKKTT